MWCWEEESNLNVPSKTQSAKSTGIKITDAEGFKNFIETGEI